jgi:hypothetical protein
MKILDAAVIWYTGGIVDGRPVEDYNWHISMKLAGGFRYQTSGKLPQDMNDTSRQEWDSYVKTVIFNQFINDLDLAIEEDAANNLPPLEIREREPLADAPTYTRYIDPPVEQPVEPVPIQNRQEMRDQIEHIFTARAANDGEPGTDE